MPRPATVAVLAAAAISLLVAGAIALVAGVTADGDGGGRRAAAPTATTAPTGDGGADADPEPTGPTTTLAGPFGGIEPATTVPNGTATVTISRAVSGKAAGEPQVRCVKGTGFFDVVMSFDPAPARINATTSLLSVSFGAPGFKGPGSYAADADEAAYGLLVADDDGMTTEFFVPEEGDVRGKVEIASGGRSGSFELRGLVDGEGRALDATGEFSCGEVAAM